MVGSQKLASARDKKKLVLSSYLTVSSITDNRYNLVLLVHNIVLGHVIKTLHQLYIKNGLGSIGTAIASNPKVHGSNPFIGKIE